ncbi:transposase [Chryseobacterium indologenes]|uniref:Transposase n=1 Tax=Chryseobacterium indologenes TaxID=253 RepID=A0A411DIQ1_CHRID|nr:transposase [Chryseobacterium indologenes]
MNTNFRNIHIGKLIHFRVSESKIDLPRICRFLNCTEENVKEMYSQEDLPTNILMRWSKLLEYDFFRIYSQHLILYAPPSAISNGMEASKLPKFKKNLYTQEIIAFVLELIKTGEKTKRQIVDEYGIPNSTLNKWVNKYNTI